MSMIKLENVSKYYKSEETVSVGMKNINLEFSLGEFIAVTGESGSGKSTLLNVISGLDGYEDGELYLFGEETSHYTIADWEKYRGTHIGFVFQNYNIIDSYTVLQNVLLALEVQGYDPKTRKQRALELIDKVGLTSHKNHKASKLSGGQKQRTVIARALAKDCPIIVADEPTGNLDSASGAQVLKVLHELSKDKLIIVVTHEYSQVAEYATRRIKMHDGEVVEDKKIKKPEDVKQKDAPKIKGMPFHTLLRFTLRNLFATPKRLVFLVFMQMLVMVAFTLFYTFRLSSIREMEVAQSQRFPNVPETRVLIEKRDGQDFDIDDLTYFNNIRFVSNVYEQGLNFYNSTRLYIFKSENIHTWGNSTYMDGMYVEGTDAASTLREFNIEGSMPIAKNEIVIGHNWYNYQVGETVKIGTSYSYVYDGVPINNDDFIGNFVISGIDKTKSNILYFSEAFLSAEDEVPRYIENISVKNSLINQAYYGFGFLFGSNYHNLEKSSIDIPGKVIRFDDGSGNPIEYVTTQSITFNGYIYNESTWSTEEVLITVEDVHIHYNNVTYYATMSGELADIIKDYVLDQYSHFYLSENRPVLSLSVSGLSAGNRAIRTIDYEKYRVIYPANIPDPTGGIFVFMQSLFTGVFLFIFGVLLYSIVHAVTKNMMKTRQKDFAIYRSIGTNKTTLARLVVLEQVFIALISSIMMFIVLYILGLYVPFIYRIIQYMENIDYVILIGIFLFFGAWLGLRFNKKIFKQSVIESIVLSREE
jgi:putative ABC transport system permease protein